MIKKGVYAASLSVINNNLSLNIPETINHAANLIKEGLHGVFFFGSTGQSQLISMNEKKELVSSLSTHKLKKYFFLGTGCNSLKENIDFIQYSMEYGFNTFLIMPPAYYKANENHGVFLFYKELIKECPKIKIIIYNFEKLSGFLFSDELIKNLKKTFPKNIIGCKDSSYNLFEKLKIDDFLIFPGSEAKLLKGLELGCAGCISAVTNVTHSLARKVFDDFENKKDQTLNEKLILVRKIFDKYNLISAVHYFMTYENERFNNLLPPLTCLSQEKGKALITELENLNFLPKKGIAA